MTDEQVGWICGELALLRANLSVLDPTDRRTYLAGQIASTLIQQRNTTYAGSMSYWSRDVVSYTDALLAALDRPKENRDEH